MNSDFDGAPGYDGSWSPWCLLCWDKEVIQFAGTNETGPCPDCCPSEEAIAERYAEYQQAVADGRIKEDDPF